MRPRPVMRDALPLSRAKRLIACLAAHEAVLLLSSPGVGKSMIVHEAAAERGMAVRSLLGTQIAPEDVSGVPRIDGRRTVFCPPRLVLPTDGRPYCLFLDELPAAPAEVQKAFYSLLLERRLGEHHLPSGTWVIAAGNWSDDKALVRPLSSALVNRVFLIPLRVDNAEWLAWAERSGVRAEVRFFIETLPAALQRPAPGEPAPFSTPRAWALLARDMDLAEAAGQLDAERRRSLAFGRVSPHDAALFCSVCEDGLSGLRPMRDYLDRPELLPTADMAKWFVVSRARQAVTEGTLVKEDPAKVDRFLAALPEELRFAALVDLVPQWARLGASAAMMRSLREVTGL